MATDGLLDIEVDGVARDGEAGQTVRLRDLLDGRPLVVVFVRHFG